MTGFAGSHSKAASPLSASFGHAAQPSFATLTVRAFSKRDPRGEYGSHYDRHLNLQGGICHHEPLTRSGRQKQISNGESAQKSIWLGGTPR